MQARRLIQAAFRRLSLRPARRHNGAAARFRRAVCDLFTISLGQIFGNLPYDVLLS
jgi:hypothetical protein